ncbi:MAG: SH3 domain-containing protein [Geminicoccaceae bacterium]
MPGQDVYRPSMTFDDLDTAASGLNDALDGARSKLDQLREAANIAAIAAALRDELEAAAEENNRLAAALTKAEATQRSLETSLEKSDDQLGSLTKELEEVRSEASDLSEQLRDSRGKTSTIDVARVAAVERAERAENQLSAGREQIQGLSQENKAFKDKLKKARLERDDARIETELTRQERDNAHQELDTIRLRIAGLLRSVLHADEAIDAAVTPRGASSMGTSLERAAPAASPQTTAANHERVEHTYTIVQTSNIRAEPHRDADRVDIGVAGEKVSVLRKTPDDNWFEVETVRGITGYIFGELIEPAS